LLKTGDSLDSVNAIIDFLSEQLDNAKKSKKTSISISLDEIASIIDGLKITMEDLDGL
jgi:hypothetical protein